MYNVTMNKVEYLLTCVSEECGEVSQAACKANRFGLHDSAPDSTLNNQELIVKEMNDLLAVIEMLKEEGVELIGIGDRGDIKKKRDKVTRYMRYSRNIGCLD